jgi:hypothetical protein
MLEHLNGLSLYCPIFQLVWPVPLAQVLLLCPQLIFPSKTSFFGIYLEISAPEIIFKIISPTFLNPNLTK